MSGIKFFDPDSNNDSSIDPKTDIYIENDILLCDSCKNVILKPYKDHTTNKLICPQCLTVYDPKYEYIQIQDQETTIDELSNQGKMGFVNEDKKIRKKTTLNRQQNDTLDNLEYINKEFDRYRQTEIIDKDTISNKLRRRQTINNND